MTPLIDVVFLLLTFFIYSFAMMIQAEVLPVKLAAVAAGASTLTDGPVATITVDGNGGLYFDRQPVTAAQLDERLAAMAKQPTRPRLFLALEAEGRTDRGPLLILLIQRVQAAGITDFVIVGGK